MHQASARPTTRPSELLRQLEVIRAFGEALGSTDEEVGETALGILPQVACHDIALLHLLARDGEHLFLRANRGVSAALLEVSRVLALGSGLPGEVAASGHPRRVTELTRSMELPLAVQEAAVADGIRTFAFVPVRARGRVLGTLTVGRRSARIFTDEETALLSCAADQIGVALDHAQQHVEARHQIEGLERAQSAVVKAERLTAVGELTRGVVHEINNPLTIILGQVEMLLADAPGDDVERGLSVIQRAGKRAAGVVRDLRQFADPAPAQRTPCQLAEHAQRAIAAVESQLRARRIACETDLEDGPPVWADGGQLGQLLRHLIDNAAQAMATFHDGGTLTVRVARIHSGMRLEVADDGPGIAAEHLPRIFNPFFTTKDADDGRGLGLSVAHGIVREHGGRIWAENLPEGGARFVVELPFGLRGAETTPSR